MKLPLSSVIAYRTSKLLRALYAKYFYTKGDKTRNILSNKDLPIDTSTSGTGSRGKGITLDLGNGTPTSSAGRERREGEEEVRRKGYEIGCL